MMFGMNSWWSQGTHVCWNHHASVNMPWFILGRSTFSNPLYLPVLETCWDRHSISGRPTSQPNPLWLGSDGRNLHSLFFFFGIWNLHLSLEIFDMLVPPGQPAFLKKTSRKNHCNTQRILPLRPWSSNLPKPGWRAAWRCWILSNLRSLHGYRWEGVREAEKCTGKGFLDLLAHRRLCHLT